ncbi:hypothetical protein SBBP2_1530019 [Burkholderiales bacterium]|nr:hypothetical protein SBBP2_1530019 [Burkholderiales bacterium]
MLLSAKSFCKNSVYFQVVGYFSCLVCHVYAALQNMKNESS